MRTHRPRPFGGAFHTSLAGVLGVLALFGAAPALAGRGLPDAALEEMPAWRSQGSEVQIKAVRALLDMGNTFAALDILRTMREGGADSAEVDLLQGEALRMDGVSSEAERLLLLAQKKLGRDGRPAAQLCILYAELHRVDEAIDACDKATSIDPADAASWNNLGYLLVSAGQPEEGVEAAEQAVQVDATQPRYRNNLGVAQASAGRADIAFRTLKSSMPTGDAAYMVGLARERYGTEAEARSWMERALHFDPQHPEAKAWLAGTPAAATNTQPMEGADPAPAEVQ